MPPQHPRRRLLGISQATAWIGSTSLVLLAGCVDAPEPATSRTPPPTQPMEVAPVQPAASVQVSTEPTPVATTEPTPTMAEEPDPDGWVTSPQLPAPKQTSTVEPTRLPAPEPTLAEPTPSPSPVAIDAAPPSITAESVPSLAVHTPAPGEPTLAETGTDRAALLPTPITPTPLIPEATPKPLEVVKPRGLILISPRNAKQIVPPVVAWNEPPQPPGERPAVVLPPSPAANAALLSPLPTRPPGEIPAASGASAGAASLASVDPKSMTPALATPSALQPVPPPGSGETPVSPVSIRHSIPELPPGFTALFNNKDLTGWEVYDGKSEAWQFKNGEVSCVSPGGGWLQTLALYTDFELRFEYRLSPGGNSGVCLRFPGHGNPSLEGLEIQLLDDRADKYQSIQAQQATGSLYFVTAPQVRDAARAAGEWNQCTLRCVGDQLQVTINDRLVNEIDLAQLKSKASGDSQKPSLVRCPMGSVALQSHSTRVDFRQVWIHDLTQALASGVRSLDLREGSGDSVPEGAKVTVHYIGFLSTGNRFANSFEKDKPTTVPLKDVIPGWREGIPGMKVGGRRRLIVPAEMAYGAKGFKEIVPPNSTLVYEIELTGFEKLAESPGVPTAIPPATADTGTTEVK